MRWPEVPRSPEARHGSLKTAIDQALRLRGSRCFDDSAGYEAFIKQLIAAPERARTAWAIDVRMYDGPQSREPCQHGDAHR